MTLPELTAAIAKQRQCQECKQWFVKKQYNQVFCTEQCRDDACHRRLNLTCQELNRNHVVFERDTEPELDELLHLQEYP